MQTSAVVRRGKTWQVRVGKDPRTGKWIRKSATCDTKAEAEKAERRLLAEAEGNRARFVEPAADSLGAYLDAFLEREKSRLRPRTLQLYSTLVRVHVPRRLVPSPWPT